MDRSRRHGRFARVLAPALLVGTILGGHLLLIEHLPHRRLFGDEHTYARAARADAHRGPGSLLPGRLRLSHHPSFHGHVLSQIAPDTAEPKSNARKVVRHFKHELFRRARYFNLVLTAITLLGTYGMARLLGLSPGLALLPPLLLAILPRLVFHAHSLWSETLHMALQSGFFLALLASLRGRSRAFLFVAGVCLGFAVLTRATLLYFVPIAVGLVAVHAFYAAATPTPRRLGQAATTAGLLLLGLGVVIVPQYAKSVRSGYGLRLSTNTWRNLEYGLGKQLPGDPPGFGIQSWDEAKRRYADVRGAPRLHAKYGVQRELLARARTLEFVASLPVSTLIARQAEKAASMLLFGKDQFQHAVKRKRFGPEQSARLATVSQFDRVYFAALVLAGLLALPLVAFRDAGWALVAAFAGYYLIAFAAVPINARVAIQLAPALCLLATAGGAQLASLLARAAAAIKSRSKAA